MPLSLGELLCSVFADNKGNHSRQRGSWPRLTKNAGPRMEQTAKKTGKKLAPLIFDHQELLARVENDRELLRDLLTIFKEDFPRQLLTLREAVEAKDGDLALQSRSFPGAATAARLEQMGRKKEILGFQEAFGVFEDDVNNLLPQLDACMAEVCK